MPVLKLRSFVFWWDYRGSLPTTQHWLSPLLFSGFSKAFTTSVCTRCYFSSQHRHYVFLTPTDLYNPCLLLCHGALGGAGCCPLSYCLDLLTGRPGWTPDLTHCQPHPGCSTEPSPWLSWPCCGTLSCLSSTTWDPGSFPRIHSSSALMAWVQRLCLSQQDRTDAELQLLGGNGETNCKREGLRWRMACWLMLQCADWGSFAGKLSVEQTFM